MEEKNLNFNNIILENREKISVTGIIDVFNYDDSIAIVETELGLLTIKGEELKINKLSIESQDLIIEGIINSINYTENDIYSKKGKSILNKLFK